MATLGSSPAAIQRDVSAIVPDGMARATGLLLPPQRVVDRLQHFHEDVYDLSAESHLSRFLKVLLGDGGAGGVRKKYLRSVLATTFGGNHFFDLDRFWGALFGAERQASEQIGFDPYGERATADQWFDAHGRDAQYRSRMEQLARAFNFGATAIGLELAAEALLGIDCDIYETWRYQDDPGSVQTNPGRTDTRKEFVVLPKRPITAEERFLLMRVLDRLRPADALMTIDDAGIDVYRQVAIRGVVADSTYWEITKKVTSRAVAGRSPYGTSDGEFEAPRYPFGGYQSEAWSYNTDITATLGYTDTSTQPNFERVTFDDGVHLDYPPQHALLSTDELLAGRMVSDGITTTNPLTGHTRREHSEPMAPLSVDRIDLPDLLGVLNDGRTNVQQTVRLPSQRFWSTTEREVTDTTIERLEIRFSEERLVNAISMEVSRFPHTLTAEHLDPDTDEWVPLFTHEVRTSNPNQFRALRPANTLQHPLHLGPDHWEKVSKRVPPTRVMRLRFSLVRSEGVAPKGPSGAAIPYSLAVRHLDVGYRLTSALDIPNTNLDVQDRDVASTIDVLGSRVKFSLHRRPASGLLLDEPEPWQCEPQPVPDAVVSLYADVRAPDGSPQVISRFAMEPLTSGPTFNLYHTLDSPTGDFEADATPLTSSTSTSGDVASDPYDTNYVFAEGTPAYVDVDTTPLQFSPGNPWWAAVAIQPLSASSTTEPRPVLSLVSGSPATFRDDSLLYLDGDEVVFVTQDGVTLRTGLEFPKMAEVSLLIAYIPEGDERRLRLAARVGTTAVSSVEIGLPSQGIPVRRPSAIRFGGTPEDTDLAGGYRLNAFVLKEGVLGLDDFETFSADPMRYVTRPAYPSDGPDRTGNALMRFNRAFATTAHPTGFVGGPGNRYEHLNWTPITRDYVLRKGMLTLPPTAARCFKFEFSNLTPQVTERFLASDIKVKTFPWLQRQGLDERSKSLVVDQTLPGFASLVNSGRRFRDGLEVLVFDVRGTVDELRPLPTDGLYALDPEARDRLRDRSFLYGLSPWHPQGRQPTFAFGQKHNYDLRTLNQKGRISYTVGLRRLEAYALDPLVADDTDVYHERFDDLDDFATNSWLFTPGRMKSRPTGFSHAQSETMLSLTDVEGIQFATQQSPPVQLVHDHDFRDAEALVGSDFQSTQNTHTIGDATATYRENDHTVRVARQVRIMPYGALDGTPYGDQPGFEDEDPNEFGIIENFNDLEDLTYGEIEALSTRTGTFGGIQTPVLIPSPSGRIHAAARVVAETDIENPLVLQILGPNDIVLAEESRTFFAGETVEWSVGYTLGSVSEITTLTYGYHEDDTYAGMESSGRYLDLERESEPTVTDYVRVRLFQDGASVNSWRVDALSVFDDAITWEFSNDDGVTWVRAEDVRNNPNGSVRFPQPGNQLVWRVQGFRPDLIVSALQVRPMYVGRPDRTLRISPERGPNVSPWDDWTPIHQDPEFQQWHDPIPQTWFAAFRGRSINGEFGVDGFVPPQVQSAEDPLYLYAYVDVE